MPIVTNSLGYSLACRCLSMPADDAQCADGVAEEYRSAAHEYLGRIPVEDKEAERRDEADLKVMLGGVKLARELVKMPAFDSFRGEEVSVGYRPDLAQYAGT